MFKIDGSHELTSTSQKVPCHDQAQGIYFEDGKWKTKIGEVAVSKIPVELAWKSTWNGAIFAAPRLYNDAIVVQTQVDLHQLRQLIFNNQIIAHRVDS